jgi:DNA-binding response OmpR family regulator
MALVPRPLATFNLSQTSILVLTGSSAEMDLYVQMLCGFGATTIHRATSQLEAASMLSSHELDLVLVDAKLPEGDGYEFVRTLRRQPARVNFVPVLMVAGHTPRSKVALARDCGAHFIVRKPLSPGVLLERILWIAQESRAFLETEIYIGPDRRFQALGPPDGVARRRDDLPIEVGAPSGPDMDQAEVDQLFKPRKASA